MIETKEQYIILNVNKDTLSEYYRFLEDKFQKSANQNSIVIKYLDLGIKIVRLQIAYAAFLQQLESFFSCSLKDTASHYDETIYIWKDDVFSYIDEQYKKLKWISITNEDKIPIKINLDEKTIKTENIEEKTLFYNRSFFL